MPDTFYPFFGKIELIHILIDGVVWMSISWVSVGLTITILQLVVIICCCQGIEFDNMSEVLKEQGIIPDVVSEFLPVTHLTIDYGGFIADGSEYTPKATARTPQVTYEGDPGSLYTVVYVDPDAPSRAAPKFRNWLHWLVVNIKGNDLSTGDVVTSYIGPGPPAGTGPHRYTFWVYKQEAKIDVHHLHHLKEERRSFDLKDFAQKEHLGNPLGFAYFLARHE